jgi:nitroreductase
MSHPIPVQTVAPVLTPDQLVAVQHRRYSTKKYDPARTIPAPLWDALEQTLQYSASSTGIQPWRFLVVGKETRQKLLDASGHNRGIVGDASHLVVFAARRELVAADVERHVANFIAVRHLEGDAAETLRQRQLGFLSRVPADFDSFQFSAYQVYIALGNLLTSATLLGLDSTPIGGFEPAAYDRILGLDATPYRSVVLATLGYHAADDANANAAKVRFPIEQVIQHV